MYERRQEIVDLLKQSYSMELETVMNYLANSTNLDGVRAEQIKSASRPTSLRKSCTLSS